MTQDAFDKAIAKAKPEVAREALLERMRDYYRGSLYLTAKELCGYSDVTKYTHGGMIEALEADTPRKLLVMPRGTFKSSVGVVSYSIWQMIRNPNVRILLDSEKYSQSRNFIREIKGKVTSDKFIKLFGDPRGKAGWGDGEITLAQRTKTFKEATVTAGGVEADKTGAHFDIIIMDDLNTATNSQNQEQREKVMRHYRYNTSILDPGGIMVVIGTRYATDDVIGNILRNEVTPPKGLLTGDN